jgi:prevent-host-death family protein
MLTVSSAEAQNRFGQLLDTVQREPVAITRHGRPTAFVVSPREMESLLSARRSKAAAELESWSTEAAKSQSREQAAAAAALTDEDVVRMVHESR